MSPVKQGLKHPVVQRLGGITIGAMASFFMILGGYKNAFEQMKLDVSDTKSDISQIKLDVAVLKARFDEKKVSILYNK